MPIVYIAGDAPGVGVTATATGLSALLGNNVTLTKAASFLSQDPDSAFHRTLLPGATPPPSWPITLTSADDADRVAAQAAGATLPPGMTIVEGVSGAGAVEERLHIDAAIAGALDAQVLLVSRPGSASPAQAAKAFGHRLAGVVINAVPAVGLHAAQNAAAPAFRDQGIAVLGLVPEDRRMLAPTVRGVAERLGADCINRDELQEPEAALDALVEHFMLGGLFLDTGVYVFGRHEQKAVIVRGDRPDLQMAALDTSTVCLVLTEGRLPVQYITHHAGLNQTPMLLASGPTLASMEALHTIGERATVHSVHKARRFAELLSTHCDLTALTKTAAA